MNEVMATLHEIRKFSASSSLILQQTSVKLCTLIKDDKKDVLILWSHWAPVGMKLWPSYSEIRKFSASSYVIVQLTWLKVYTLIKDDSRDILILFPPFQPWSPIQVKSWPSWSKNEFFQPPTDLLFNNISLTWHIGEAYTKEDIYYLFT